MEFEGDSLDAILIKLYQAFQTSCGHNDGSRGPNIELLGVSLRLTKPRARLSRSENRGKLFSALGELLWYLGKSDQLDFIEPYVPEYKKDAIDGHIHGAYGPRLFAMRGIDQLSSVTELLRNKPGSRRAVVQIFNAEDIVTRYPEVPCTTTLQFFIRDGKLHLSTTMRSNDAVWGLPHDVFCFTMIQEIMARRLEVELGEYYHYVGSMHVYDDYIDQMNGYLAEGHHRTVEMPSMPSGDPFPHIPQLLNAEDLVRRGVRIAASEYFSISYWADLVRLVQVFWATGQATELDGLKAEFADPIYRSYLEGRRNMKPKTTGSSIHRND